MVRRTRRSGSAVLCFATVLALLARPTPAADVTWSGANTSWTQPDGDSFSAAYNSGDNVTFGDTGIGTVSVTAGGVTPGNVSFSNTAGTYTVSGGTIGGTGLITKTGAGTVQVNTSTDILADSGTGGIGLSVQAGTFFIRADSSRTYTFFGNSATAIQIDGGTFSFRPNSTQNTLANALQVTASGGTLNTVNFSGNGVRTILGGSLALGGNLTWAVGGAGTAPGGSPPYRDNLNGTVTLTGGDRKLTLNGSDVGGYVTIAGNITQDTSPRKLTLEFSSFSPGLILSGNNTGLTGGIDLAFTGAAPAGAMARFASANAMGGGGAGSISVPSQTAVGFDFAPTAIDLARIKSGSTGMVMLGVDSSQDIDFSAGGLNADMRLGACPGTTVTYTGTLTPNGSTYRVGGGGTLTLSGTNALTGARNVVIGAGVLNEQMPSGVLVLSGTNNYTGTTTVNYSSGGSYPLKLGIDNALPVTTTLTVNQFAGVDLDGYSQEVAGLSGGGTTFGVRNLSATQSTFTINRATDDLGMNGVLNGNIAFAKKGAARLVMRSNQNYTGPTTVLAGKLQMFQSGEGSLPSTAMTVDGSAAVLDLTYYWTGTAWNPSFSSLTLDHGGTVSNSGAAASTLTAGAYDLRDGTAAVVLAGATANLSKSTSGTVTLTKNNTYGGTTTVSQGTLLVNGTLSAGGGAVTVNGAATLGGSGTINRPVTISDNAILAPGTSAGTLTLGAGLTFNSTSVVNFELGSGTSDRVDITDGAFTLDGVLNVTQLAGFGPQPGGLPGVYVLFDYAGASGFTNNGLDLGSLGPNSSGWIGTIDPLTGSQVRLLVIPEPAAGGLLALGGLALLRRRRGEERGARSVAHGV